MVSPVSAVVLMVTIMITLIGVMTFLAVLMCGCGEGIPSPIVQLDLKREGSDYKLSVVKISQDLDLKAFSYYLKNGGGLTKQFGEIALQNISGQWHGVDVTWDDDGQADYRPGNRFADRSPSAEGAYSDPYQAQLRLDDVQAGFQGPKDNQKSEGTISVLFNDSDRNGKFTAGDQFTILGNSLDHPANDDWRLEIKYDITDDTIGSFKLGA